MPGVSELPVPAGHDVEATQEAGQDNTLENATHTHGLPRRELKEH